MHIAFVAHLMVLFRTFTRIVIRLFVNSLIQSKGEEKKMRNANTEV